MGGAYCDLCTCSKQQYLEIERIEGGFETNRSIETLHNIFDNLVQENGSILKEKGDYNVRAGVTNKPTNNDAQSLQVLHALLRSFDHYVKTAVHVKAVFIIIQSSQTTWQIFS